jgi:AraC-like DNA-binding protein
VKEKLCGGIVKNSGTIVAENENSTTYNLKNEDGEIKITEYQVFPGIWLLYEDIHAQNVYYPLDYPTGVLEILHCREGRFEYNAGDRFFYLSEGDLAVNQKIKSAEGYCPFRCYQGISIVIDPLHAELDLPEDLEDIYVNPRKLIGKFCGENRQFIMRSTQRLEHIFSELYTVQKQVKKGYMKIKILELLLFLDEVDPKCSQEEQRTCSKMQVELVKNVCDFMNAHMDMRPTIQELSEKFYVSSTQLKKSFHDVCGESVYGYIRMQRMQTADKSISEIASDFGYENKSKFSSAFCEVIGENPAKYRKNQMEKNRKKDF